MLRLIQSLAAPLRIIALEGKLTAPWLPELRAAVAEARASGGVSLNLAGLSFVDHDGAELLRTLRKDGVQLMGASRFIEELLVAPARPG
jgi:anti-anti-sigma regulatory factor